MCTALQTPSFKPMRLSSVRLSQAEIHVWRLDLTTLLPKELSILSADEWQQAQRKHVQSITAKQDYLNSRYWLRMILGAYLHEAPERLVFYKNAHGKPYLHTQALQFNLSHSQRLVLLAISQHEIGIDLEYYRPIKHPHRIARRLFSEAERQALQETDDTQGLFLRFWTALEARQKALGHALFLHRAQAQKLAYRHFSPANGFVATLAWKQASSPQLRFYCPQMES